MTDPGLGGLTGQGCHGRVLAESSVPSQWSNTIQIYHATKVLHIADSGRENLT